MVVFFVTVLLSARVIAADPAAALDAHLASHSGGGAAFTFDRPDYEGDLSSLPIGVFDSGVGGLTVLEAILTFDAYHNDNLKPGADGRPDFEKERFLSLGDQANMPYGNYAAVGKLGYLRELILKDAVLLLGKRYYKGDAVRFDKPPVKALVIACNTATACGLDDIKSLVSRLGVPVIVVGVVEAGARGLLSTETDPDGAIGVMATVGTCASEVYPHAPFRAPSVAPVAVSPRSPSSAVPLSPPSSREIPRAGRARLSMAGSMCAPSSKPIGRQPEGRP